MSKQNQLALIVLSMSFLLVATACSTENEPKHTTATNVITNATTTTVTMPVSQSEASVPLTTSASATKTEPVVLPNVTLMADGSEVAVRSVSIADYVVGAFCTYADDASLAADAPTIAVDARYFEERDWLRYRFSDGRVALSERYFLFADGVLVNDGDSRVSPTETGEYLMVIDFLFCENAAVSAERVMVKLDCTRGERYESELAQGYPYDPHRLIFASDASAEVIAGSLSGMHTFTAETEDPAEALAQYFTAKLKTRQQTSDATRAIEDFRILVTRTNAVHLLERYRSYAVYFRYAVKPASDQFVYSQTLAPVWGEGDLNGWAIYDGTVYLKHCGDSWLWIDSSMPGESTSLSFGFVWCGDEALTPVFEPSLFVVPENWRTIALDGDHSVLEASLYMDWNMLKACFGDEGVEYFMARLRANAFSTLTNRSTSRYSDIFTDPRVMPQSLRVAMLLNGAKNIPDTILHEYAILLRDLQAVDPISFAEAWEQLAKADQKFVQALMAG